MRHEERERVFVFYTLGKCDQNLCLYFFLAEKNIEIRPEGEEQNGQGVFPPRVTAVLPRQL